MSGIYPKGNWLFFRVKIDGKWVGVQTDFKVGQERAAKAMLAKFDARQAAGEELLGELGPVTVGRFQKAWIKAREAEVETWKNDETVMRLHVLPTLKDRLIEEVTPSEVLKLIKSWRARTGPQKMAPRSIYTAYSTLCAFFRDAAIDGLITTSPCILTKRQLGPKIDADPEWRPTAVFGRDELEALISDERVPLDRRVLYALLGIGALRYGEAAGLHWRNCDAQLELDPLGMIYVAFSYQRSLPKGDVCRPVPVHPTLAAVLAEWKLFGWAKMMGRAPTADDLVMPLPPEAVTARKTRHRRKGYIYDRLMDDLAELGLRQRRGHDLRRTMISLTRAAGANRDILRRATHKPPKEVIEGYTTFEWDVLCAEVLKLRVERRGTGRVLAMPRGKLATSLATNGVETMDNIEEEGGLRPGSSPGRATENEHDRARLSRARSPRSTTCESGESGETSVEHDQANVGGSKVASELGRRLRAVLVRYERAGR